MQRLQKRLAGVSRHQRALRAAIQLFEPDFDPDAFRAAATSDDPAELGKANQVQAAFENTHNHLIGIAQDVAKLKGWSPDPNAGVALRLLKQYGVISEAVRKRLHDAQTIRSNMQHAYAEVTADELHTGARNVDDHADAFVMAVVAFLMREGIARPSAREPLG